MSEPPVHERIALGADHGGFELKKELVEGLRELKYVVDDLGGVLHRAVRLPGRRARRRARHRRRDVRARDPRVRHRRRHGDRGQPLPRRSRGQLLRRVQRPVLAGAQRRERPHPRRARRRRRSRLGDRQRLAGDALRRAASGTCAASRRSTRHEVPLLLASGEQGHRLAGVDGGRRHPAASRVRGLRAPLHEPRARRGRAARRGEEGRRARAVRPREGAPRGPAGLRQAAGGDGPHRASSSTSSSASSSRARQGSREQGASASG